MKRWAYLSIGWGSLVLLLLAASVLSAGAQENGDARIQGLVARLEQLRVAREKAEAVANEINWQYVQFQKDIAYSNETTKVLYEEVKHLEKALNEKRKELTDAMIKVPAYREIEKRRASAMSTLSQLREEEAITQADIQKLGGKVPLVSTPAEMKKP